jgi:hypothetical protein
MAAPTESEAQGEPAAKRPIRTSCHCCSIPGIVDRPEWPAVPASRFHFWRRAVYTVTAGG